MNKLIDVAKALAKYHRNADKETTDVWLSPDPNGKEIRLVEVSGAAPTTNEVIPFRFGTDLASGIDYPSVVILLSTQEWQEVNAGRLALPHGWDRDKMENL